MKNGIPPTWEINEIADIKPEGDSRNVWMPVRVIHAAPDKVIVTPHVAKNDIEMQKTAIIAKALRLADVDHMQKSFDPTTGKELHPEPPFAFILKKRT